MRAVDSGPLVGDVGKVWLQREQTHRSGATAARDMLGDTTLSFWKGMCTYTSSMDSLEAYHHWKVGVLRLSGQRLAEGGQLQASH